MRLDAAPQDNEVLMTLMSTLQELMATVVAKTDEFRALPGRRPAVDVGERRRCSTARRCRWRRSSTRPACSYPAGRRPTRTAIAHGLRAFCDHADQWELLYEQPEHLQTAVDEVIRWVTPLNNMFRTATRDVEVRGVPIEAGDRVAARLSVGQP